jgi:hypothetical protein
MRRRTFVARARLAASNALDKLHSFLRVWREPITSGGLTLELAKWRDDAKAFSVP